MAREDKIEFEKLEIDESYGDIINDVYLVIKNDRCPVLDALEDLEEGDFEDMIDLISRMATIEDFKSPKIRLKLRKYSYGEIKPWGHRVFFFKKFEDNIILFSYKEKKRKSLGDKFYKKLEKEKKEYEQEFEKQNK